MGFFNNFSDFFAGGGNRDIKNVKFDPMTGRIIDIGLHSDQPKTPTNKGPGMITDPNRPTSQAPTSPGEDKTFLGRMFSGTLSPQEATGLSRLLGTLGSAFTAKNPNSWQYQLGQSVQGTAAGRQAEALGRGEELSGLAGFGITPAEREAVMSSQFQRQQLALAERRIAALEGELGLKAREETPEERKARELEVAGARPAAVKGYQLQTIPVGGQNVTVVFDPNAGAFAQVATSPIQESGNAASLRADQRQFYFGASKLAAQELSRMGYGDIIQLADGSWTIKFNAEIIGDKERLTDAENQFRTILDRRLKALVKAGKLPESFLSLEPAPENEEEEFTL